ncbi:unnamed protein product [Lathyrus oleraceus]
MRLQLEVLKDVNIDVAMFFLFLCYFIHQKLMRRHYVAAVIFSQFLLLDMTLITKLLKNDKLLKLCYVTEDSEDLKTDD